MEEPSREEAVEAVQPVAEPEPVIEPEPEPQPEPEPEPEPETEPEATSFGQEPEVREVRTKEEYDSLPSGTLFKAPDGSIRVKP